MKRFAAIVLPSLLCELARLDGPLRGISSRGVSASSDGKQPFAVIVDDETRDVDDDDEVDSRAIVDAVDPLAWRYGARVGQSAAEAAAFVGKLRVVRLERARVMGALAEVAEIALGFGTTAALKLECHEHERREATKGSKKGARFAASYPGGGGAGPFDTVWLDVSGCARLVGGEDLLCAELQERAEKLGHRARVVIADGPRVAQAVARWGMRGPARDGRRVVESGRSAEALAALPIAALPFGGDTMAWLGKLGIFSIGDMARLERSRLAPRLAQSFGRQSSNTRRADDCLALVDGHDRVPLLPYEPPRIIVEQQSFEHELDGTEPLLFVLRGLVARACARLAARGEACSRAGIELDYDLSIARLRGIPHNTHVLTIELPIALSNEDDLLRALHAKLERTELGAPVTSVRLLLDGLTHADRPQLELEGRGKASPHELPTLLAELSAWVGEARVGVLSQVDSHRPEARSALVPIDLRERRRRRAKPATASGTAHALTSALVPEPTRILARPIPVGTLQPGALIAAGVVTTGPRGAARFREAQQTSGGHSLYLIDHLKHASRIDQVEWWTPDPVCRDYARAWLHTSAGLRTSGPGRGRGAVHARASDQHEYGEAWVFIDRATQRCFLHGWYD
jgi:protein ImuB